MKTYEELLKDIKQVEVVREGDELKGWIAIYKGKKLEIKLDKDADSLYGAKKFAMKELKVPNSKKGLLSIAPAYQGYDMKTFKTFNESRGDDRVLASIITACIKKEWSLTKRDVVYYDPDASQTRNGLKPGIFDLYGAVRIYVVENDSGDFGYDYELK